MERATEWLDKDNIPRFSGDPAFSKEREERVWLPFESCRSQEERSASPLKLKNALSDCARNMCHRNPDICVAKLLGSDPRAARGTPRRCSSRPSASPSRRPRPCTRPSPITSDEVIDVEARTPMISIVRRPNGYDRLLDITNNNTQVSEDVLFALSNDPIPTCSSASPPTSMVFLQDTGALAAFVSTFGVMTTFLERNIIFNGVTPSAPIRAESEQEIPMGIGGVGCTMRFKRLPNSSTFILLSLDQLKTVGACLRLEDNGVALTRLDKFDVPLARSRGI